jgi:hypothetical protein
MPIGVAHEAAASDVATTERASHAQREKIDRFVPRATIAINAATPPGTLNHIDAGGSVSISAATPEYANTTTVAVARSERCEWCAEMATVSPAISVKTGATQSAASTTPIRARTPGPTFRR